MKTEDELRKELFESAQMKFSPQLGVSAYLYHNALASFAFPYAAKLNEAKRATEKLKEIDLYIKDLPKKLDLSARLVANTIQEIIEQS